MEHDKKTTYLLNNGTLRIPSREEFHRGYSGHVYVTDYAYPISLSAMANRISSNLKFDQQCGKQIDYGKGGKK